MSRAALLAFLFWISPSFAAPTELFKVDPTKSLADQDWQGGHLASNGKDYSIVTENGKSFVRSTYEPDNDAEYLYRTVQWELYKQPYLTWRWRVHKFPPEAKVLDPKKSDAAAQIYFLWKVGRRKNVIKYFWGVNDKVGEELKQESMVFGRLWGLIVRNGPPWAEWQTESRNVLEDYRKGFGEDPPKEVMGVAVMSDGDQSHGPAEADFADFFVSDTPQAPPTAATAAVAETATPAPEKAHFKPPVSSKKKKKARSQP